MSFPGLLMWVYELLSALQTSAREYGAEVNDDYRELRLNIVETIILRSGLRSDLPYDVADATARLWALEFVGLVKQDGERWLIHMNHRLTVDQCYTALCRYLRSSAFVTKSYIDDVSWAYTQYRHNTDDVFVDELIATASA